MIATTMPRHRRRQDLPASAGGLDAALVTGDHRRSAARGAGGGLSETMAEEKPARWIAHSKAPAGPIATVRLCARRPCARCGL